MSKVGFNWNANKQSASQHSNDCAIFNKHVSVLGDKAILPRRGGWKGSKCTYLKSMLYRLSSIV